MFEKLKFRSYLRVRGKNQEEGVAILEFAIIAFGLFIGTLLFIDVTTVVIQYLKLTQVTFEGVKVASRLSNLEQGSLATFQNVDAGLHPSSTHQNALAQCSANVVTTEPCSHLLVQQRVRFLLDNLNFLVDVGPDTTVISSSLIGPVADPRQVQVSINTSFGGLWLNNMRFTSTSEGPYLVR